MTLCSTECENCVYGTVVEESKARVYITCESSGKKIIYGKIIECDNYNKEK